MGRGERRKRSGPYSWFLLALLLLTLAGGPTRAESFPAGAADATMPPDTPAPVTPTPPAVAPPEGSVPAAEPPVEGVFARFWARWGGLARFGLPLTPAVRDPTTGPGDGSVVQWFERARFEYHPEAGPRYQVQLTLLGAAALGDRSARFDPPHPCVPDDGSDGGCEVFPATEHTLRGAFRRHWRDGGGLTSFGFPLTEELREVNQADGKEYTVQYFERARFEHHPENAAPYDVLLGQLGRETLAARPDVAALPPVAVPDGAIGPTIVLDVGHDRTTGGALGREYRDTLRTALATKRALEARGYAVLLTRDDDDTVLMNDPALLPADPSRFDAGYVEGYVHASKILALGPDLAISIHYNAAPSGPGGGSTTYYSPAGGPQNERLASLVQREIGLALRDRGYVPPYSRIDEDLTIGKTYGGLATLGNVADPAGRTLGNRMVGLPIVLTEALFVTNPAERALIADDATIERLAEGYANAVDAFFAP